MNTRKTGDALIPQNKTQPASAAPKKADPQAHEVEKLLAVIETSLDDDQAIDVITIDLKGKSSIGDYMVIASGRSGRHVGAVADHLLTNIKVAGFGSAHCEGLSASDWVLIDTGDIIIHLFRPEVRDFYSLEKMWSPSLIDDELDGDMDGDMDDEIEDAEPAS